MIIDWGLRRGKEDTEKKGDDCSIFSRWFFWLPARRRWFSHEDQKVLLQLHEDNRFDDGMGHIRKQA